MSVRHLFATPLYQGDLGQSRLLDELVDACLALAAEDRAGRAWSKQHGYRGYTSYASLDDLPRRDPRFGDLVKLLDKHVAVFAADCAFQLHGRLKLDSRWVTVLKPSGMHSGHIHPHRGVSGTVYIAVPLGSGRLKLDDPRLAMMMVAPRRRGDAPEALQPFVHVEPQPGMVLLWESWLRHEVIPSTAKGERISISFNYRQ